MGGTYHEFDPNGDVILVLRNANAPFAVWRDDVASDTKKRKKGKKGRDKRRIGTDEDPPKPPVDTSSASTGVVANSTSTSGEENPEGSETRLRVSSRHLILASTYFATHLSRSWETATMGANGCRYIYAENWDEEALVILMHAIHGRHRSVPREVGLETVAKVALLVDYYDCPEAIEVFSEMWIQKLRDNLPTQFNRDLVLWIFVSYVFRQADIFEGVTRTAIEQSPGEIPLLDLPIPSIIEELNCRRRGLGNRVIGRLCFLLESFRGNYGRCSFACSSMLLGALTKEMFVYDLPSEIGIFSATQRSLADTLQIVRGFRSPEWAEVPILLSNEKPRQKHPCTLSTFIENEMRDIEAEGLSLSSFPGSRTVRREALVSVNLLADRGNPVA